MSAKIEWFVNKDATINREADEYVAIRNNIIICRIKREKSFCDFWVARDVLGNYLFRDQYRNDVIEWIETAFKE